MRIRKNILITGASGFLGTWLAVELHNAGYQLIGVDLRAPFKPNIWEAFATSSCENIDWESLIQSKNIYAVCHLAGGASVAASLQDPYSDFSNLLPGTSKLALYIIKHQIQAKLFLFSSAAVYGNPTTLPVYENTNQLPISPYGVHKLLAENLLLNYSRVFGLDITILRIFSVYGQGLRKQLIWDVANKALSAVKKNEKSILLFGTGDETRDFIYVSDICKAVVCILNYKNPENTPKIYNLASGTESKISDIAKHLIDYLDLDIDIKFNGNVPKGDPLNWRADITKLASTGFKPQFTLKEGLFEVAQWISKLE